jgi:multiple sugar transport system substrate-binding protein
VAVTGTKAAEVLTKFVIVDMYAKSIQGMPAEDVATWLKVD